LTILLSIFFSSLWTSLESAAEDNLEMTWPNPPLARSVFGWDPLDEFATTVGDWMKEVSQGVEHLEVRCVLPRQLVVRKGRRAYSVLTALLSFQIEGKVGRIVDKHTGDRINIPVRSETIVEMQSSWKFESTMSEVSIHLSDWMLGR
jgi:polynucleotide 5'-triphosphatase